MAEQTYTTFQIARICGVRPTTIIKWVNRKEIKAYVTLGGHRRVLRSDLIKFLKENNFPIPEELMTIQKKILVVEDDEAVGKLIQTSLQKISDGIEVKWTQDGIEALLTVSDYLPDLIILDVVMPVVDGSRVLSTLRSDAKTRNIKVIGITGEHLPSEKIDFIKSHTEGFFFKPFDMNEFVQKVVAVLNVHSTEKDQKVHAQS